MLKTTCLKYGPGNDVRNGTTGRALRAAGSDNMKHYARCAQALEAQAEAWRAWAAGDEAQAVFEQLEYAAKEAQSRAWKAEAEAFEEAAKMAKERGEAWKMKARRAMARRKWAAERREFARPDITKQRAAHMRGRAKEHRERAHLLEVEAQTWRAGQRVYSKLDFYGRIEANEQDALERMAEAKTLERTARQLMATGFVGEGEFARDVADEARYRAGLLYEAQREARETPGNTKWAKQSKEAKERAQAWKSQTGVGKGGGGVFHRIAGVGKGSGGRGGGGRGRSGTGINAGERDAAGRGRKTSTWTHRAHRRGARFEGVRRGRSALARRTAREMPGKRRNPATWTPSAGQATFPCAARHGCAASRRLARRKTGPLA